MNQITHKQAELILRPGTSLAELKASRPAATETDLTLAIGTLFAGRKARNGDDANSAMTLKAYVIALQGQPLFAVRNAVYAYLQNRVPGAAPAFVPSADELVAECERQFLLSVRVHPSMKKPDEMPTRHGPLTEQQLERHTALMQRLKAKLAEGDLADAREAEEKRQRYAENLKRQDEHFSGSWQFGGPERWAV